MEIDAAPTSVGAVRRWAQMHVDERVSHEVRLLLSELVTNSILHAGLGPTDRIEILLSAARGRIRAEVIDRGGGFGTVKTSAEEAPGGLGLVLLKCLASRWGVVQDEATRVWFELDVPGSEQPLRTGGP